MKAVFEIKMQSSPKFVLLSLSWHCNPEMDNLCRPSISRIVNDTGLNRKTVVKSLQLLEEDGFIVIEKKAGGVNHYKININCIPNKTAQHSMPDTSTDSGTSTNNGTGTTGSSTKNGTGTSTNNGSTDIGSTKNGTGSSTKNGTGTSTNNGTGVVPILVPYINIKKEEKKGDRNSFDHAATSYDFSGKLDQDEVQEPQEETRPDPDPAPTAYQENVAEDKDKGNKKPECGAPQTPYTGSAGGTEEEQAAGAVPPNLRENAPESQKETSANTGAVKKEKRAKKDYPDDFERFWAAYPRQVGKGNALKAWEKATKHISNDELIARVNVIKTCAQWQDKQFIPHPATWLNQSRYEDPECLPTPPPDYGEWTKEMDNLRDLQDMALSLNLIERQAAMNDMESAIKDMRARGCPFV